MDVKWTSEQKKVIDLRGTDQAFCATAASREFCDASIDCIKCRRLCRPALRICILLSLRGNFVGQRLQFFPRKAGEARDLVYGQFLQHGPRRFQLAALFTNGNAALFPALFASLFPDGNASLLPAFFANGYAALFAEQFRFPLTNLPGHIHSPPFFILIRFFHRCFDLVDQFHFALLHRVRARIVDIL